MPMRRAAWVTSCGLAGMLCLALGCESSVKLPTDDAFAVNAPDDTAVAPGDGDASDVVDVALPDDIVDVDTVDDVLDVVDIVDVVDVEQVPDGTDDAASDEPADDVFGELGTDTTDANGDGVQGEYALCKPCTSSANCGTGVCAAPTKGASFCTIACTKTTECGAGFACALVDSTEGVSAGRCTPLAGIGACPCAPGSKETCDGVDNDCDGATDESACDDGFPCTVDICDVTTGCTHDLATGPCDDGSACTTNDACAGGACSGTVLVCDDGNPCTQDSCSISTGCKTSLLTGTGCSDGDFCTVGDVCQKGVCAATAVVCDDKNPCTADACDPATGNCTYTPAEGACDDGDACTSPDACVGGECLGSNNVCVCTLATAATACDDADVCTADACAPQTGGTLACVHTPLSGAQCSDGNGCTSQDVCVGATCTAGQATVCNDGNACTDDSCDPLSGQCAYVYNTKPCQDGNPCTENDVCQSGQCASGANACACTGETAAVICNDNNVCTADTCAFDGQKWGCTHEALSATACSDGNACTQVDTCQNGLCVGADPVACTALDQCHSVGACDKVSGQCSTPTKVDGAPCDDVNGCTSKDVCQAGACLGTQPVQCAAKDECHKAGTCNPAKGQCSNPEAPAGTTCSDGDACTQADSCQAGTCVGANPVVCTAVDACHDVGTCDAATGACSTPTRPDGTPCTDGDACTLADSCVSGGCKGGAGVVCTAKNDCHEAGTCDHTNGACSNPVKTDGTSCDDGQLCTQVDTCTVGTCVGGSPVVCTAADTCHTAGECDIATGTCTKPVLGDGTACDDGDACTAGDSCIGGTCTPATTQGCTAKDGCHLAGSCDSATGLCSNPASGDGTACEDGNDCTTNDSCQSGSCVSGATICDCTVETAATVCNDGNGCTADSCAFGEGKWTCQHVSLTETPCSDGDACSQSDTCIAGSCVGSNPVVCAGADACKVAGVCDPTNGICNAPNKPFGTPCDDGNACTQADACSSGACVGSNPVVCTALDACHLVGTCDAGSGTCSQPLAADGAPCDDNNACSQVDTCASGTCEGSNPVVCEALDGCHTAGVCDGTNGKCSNPVKAEGSACNDANACTQVDSCSSGACVGATPVVCLALDGCHDVGLCDPSNGQCSNPQKANGKTCSDGDECTLNDACQAGVCAGSGLVVCPTPDMCHLAGSCNPSTGTCSNPAKTDGSTCTDGNHCTQTDTCVSGSCVGASPVVCNASDGCHIAGVCDPASGSCSNPAKSDASTCNDGDACTQLDACQVGVCVGTNPVVCSAGDGCHTVGTCDKQTGVCSNPAATDGTACQDGNSCTDNDTCVGGTCKGGVNGCTCTVETAATVCDDSNACTADVCVLTSGKWKCDHTPLNAVTCDDGNACTQTDTCVTGKCTGYSPVVCASPDQCHTSATCNPSNGQCVYPEKSAGTTCDDGNACTQVDTCASGVCTGASPIVCIASDACHSAGVCNTVTGQCSNPQKTDGTVCNDGNACTQLDKCQTGVCTGQSPITCTASDNCHSAGICDTATGICSNPAKADATACSDGNACTQTDTCVSGVCTGANPVVCGAVDACHTAGVCATATGVCSNPAKPDNSTCDDGNACTLTDQCKTGACVGSNPVTCTALDQCHDAGVCATGSGVCSNPLKSDGVTCSDGNVCTKADKCTSGSCVGTAYTCAAPDQCHNAGACLGDGTCTNPAKSDGMVCTDSNACTNGDACVSGVCQSGTAVTCVALDQCHAVGTCNIGSGQCSNPNKSNGTACTDGNACTLSDTCQLGACSAGTGKVCSALDQCHLVGTCDTSTGACSNPNITNGAACEEGNKCLNGDICQNGTCVAGSTVPNCNDSNPCTLDSCQAATGCVNTPGNNGSACTDGNACTQTDTCSAGACVGSNPVVCSASDQCHVAGVCQTASGTCTNPAQTDGTNCNDSNACTQTDRCVAGACTGTNPVVCTALDVCHGVGTCATGSGVCSNPTANDGGSCADGNPCTYGEKCANGSCTGGTTYTCTLTDNQCQMSATCNGDGTCGIVNKANATACDDGSLCTWNDKCTNGFCGGTTYTCNAPDQCHNTPVCLGDGTCTNPAKTDGTACTDGDACTLNDNCLSGVCTTTPKDCSDGNLCTADVCTGGTCSNPALACSDGNACTVDDCNVASGCVNVAAAGLEAGIGKPAGGYIFGRTIAIDTDTMVISDGYSTSWTSRVYVRANHVWTLQGSLTPACAWAPSVAISGNTVASGCVPDNKVYISTRTGTTWALSATLSPANVDAGDAFGTSVALSGSTLVVGATGEDSCTGGVTNGTTTSTNNGCTSAGAAYVYTGSGSSWTQQAFLKAAAVDVSDNFGTAVSISGNSIVVGAPAEDSAQTTITNGTSASADNTKSGAGAAYVFLRSGTTWTQQAYLKPSVIDASDAFGSSVSIATDTVLVGAPSEDSVATGIWGNQNDNSAADAGAAYAFVRSGATWSLQSYLKASNTGAGDKFGSSVAIVGDTAVVGAPREDSFATGVNGDQASNAGTDTGAGYAFTRAGTAWSQRAYLKAGSAGSQFLGSVDHGGVAVNGSTIAMYDDRYIVWVYTLGNYTCDDNNPCTDPVLTSGTCTCSHIPNAVPCTNDGNVCTDDKCGSSSCQHFANTAACTDGNVCTDEVCGGGSCNAVVDDTNACTDYNSCTLDWCSGGNCMHSNLADNAACDDGNACTLGDTCLSGACQPGTGYLQCGACESCDPGAGCLSDAPCCGDFCCLNPSDFCCQNPNDICCIEGC